MYHVTGHYPPPNNVQLTNASSEELTFSWKSLTPVCSSIRYHINSSNCGVCPTTTGSTTATCYDLQLSREKRVCKFSVQNVVCGNVGNSSVTVQELIGGIVLLCDIIIITHVCVKSARCPSGDYDYTSLFQQ